MLQKIISVGNSAAITLPKGFLEDVGLKVGDKIRVRADSESKTMMIEADLKKDKLSLSKDFVDWTGKFIKKHRLVLEELANK